MISIRGYQVDEQIYESADTLVVRGCREADSLPVVLKVLKQAYPPPRTGPERIAWFKREYEITRSLDLPGVVTAYSLETDQDRWVIVLEDFGGDSLACLGMVGTLSLSEFLTVAIQVVEILGQIHQRSIVHKDIKPSHILLNPTTRQVKLTDFGSSTVLSRETLAVRQPALWEGTLAYMSPEQTGRVNRAIDCRTDFYSLGVTFYQLLTGQLPFATDDPMELVHCHIARQPAPPCELDPGIPPILSDLVMRLLAKNAQDRYQSAYGLKADLEHCLDQLQAAGGVPGQIAAFPLGTHDLSDRLQIPQKLYGREAERAILLAALERARQGSRELILLSGPAGIGKTALVQDVYHSVAQAVQVDVGPEYPRADPRSPRAGATLIAGTFDQLQPTAGRVPYSAWIQAFRALIKQLLSGSDAEIAGWRERLLAALGPNGQVVIDLIPEVELIIGPQPAVPELPPVEAQNRFNLAFQGFARAFSLSGCPLVIWLDGLQWADAASLNLLKLLMTAADGRYLLVIGAYREEESDPVQGLTSVVEEIERAYPEVARAHPRAGTVIPLAPLNLSDVMHLVSDTLHCTPERAGPLAELVLAKTHGNPLFIVEFLKALYTDERIQFDHEHGVWQWDLARIQAQRMTDSVVELLVGKIQELEARTQQVLKLAACIGNRFDLETLAILCTQALRETVSDLRQAMADDLVRPLDPAYELVELDLPDGTTGLSVEYEFAHVRIQQAAYFLLPQAERQAVHRQIGHLLLRNTAPDRREQRIFDIVNQLNQGRDLDMDQAEQVELAELNLLAGRKAKSAAAYEPALSYLQVGVELLSPPEEVWQSHYELALALYVEAAQAAYLNGDFGQMEDLAQAVLDRAQAPLDRIKAYEVKIEACIAQNRLHEAVQTALPVVRLLGVSFPEKPGRIDVLLALLGVRLVLTGKRTGDLVDLPVMADAHKRAAMHILSSVGAATYFAYPELLALIVLKGVRLSVKYGNTSESAFAFAGYGLILCGIVGEIEAGYQFGQLALRLVDKLDARELKARTVMLVYDAIVHWKQHIRDTLGPLREAYQSGLVTGDLQFASLCAHVYSYHQYWIGAPLVELEREMASYSEAIRQFGQETALHLHGMYWQAVLNLLGRAEDPCRLVGEGYDEEILLPIHQRTKHRSAIFDLHLNKLVLCTLFLEIGQALEHAAVAEEHLDGGTGTVNIPVFYFYDSLAHLAFFPDAPPSQRRRILRKVAANQKKMQKWAHHAPMNHLHKLYLVEAERARALGREEQARACYDRAITLARENGFLNEEALANERAGRHYLAKGLHTLAQAYLGEARQGYLRWGAMAKVEALDEEHRQWLAEPGYPQTSARGVRPRGTRAGSARGEEVKITTTPVGTTSGAGGALDLSTVMKASQAIAGEIVLDRLLKQLMKIVIENAGAQTGYLLLAEEGQFHEQVTAGADAGVPGPGRWVIEAEGAVDKADVTVLQSVPIGEAALPMSLIHYVARTRETVVLDDAASEGLFSQDPYVKANRSQSVLCAPLLYQSKLTGMLYLENNLTSGAFTPDRLAVLSLLSSQIATSIENARLYATLEQKVEQRTAELGQMTREAQEARIAAEAASRAKSAFLANMSHELRTPLNAIIGYSEMLVEDFGDARGLEGFVPDLQNIRSAGKHLLSLIDDVLDLSKIEAGKMELHPETFEVTRLIEEVVSTAQPLVEANANRFQVYYADGLGTLHADLTKVRQSLLNLLSNAAKFTEGGTVTLEVAREVVGGIECITFTVRDTGIGMTPEQMSGLFQAFSQPEAPRVDTTAARKYGGTGLGLAITKRFCQMMGGEITVESQVGVGSTFIIRLPSGGGSHR